jgi:hypothetical protein
MDLKSKGMAWAGDIYQKFEIMCHEVDNVVKQVSFFLSVLFLFFTLS